jgi:hypothetical protein
MTLVTGVLTVPKYTSREVGEPVPAVQLKFWVILTDVAPVAGLGTVAAPGGGGTVVKLQTVPVVVPPTFFSSTRQ